MANRTFTACCAILGAAAWLAPAGARADVTADQCIDANTHAQQLRRAGKFVEARAQLAICGDSRCPAMVRDDCAQRLDELDRAQPTMVFDVKDASGSDVAAVKVSMDGRVVADRAAGTAVAVDPGEHEFTFEVAGQPPVVQRFVSKEGEKGRRERIVVGSAPTPSPAAQVSALGSGGSVEPALAVPPPARASAAASGAQRTLGLVLAGVGIAGIAAGSVFGLLATSSSNNQKSECSSTNCPAASHEQAMTDHDTASRDALLSTVGFIAGGALLAGGAALFLTAPTRAAAEGAATGHSTTTTLWLRPNGFAVSGEF